MTTMTQTVETGNGTVPDDDILIQVNNLKMYFPVTSGMLFQRTVANVKAVDDISFSIRRGETLGLVGESGCGKTTTGRCILQLYKPTEGQVVFEGQDLTKMNNKQMRAMRREMQVIFQDPYSSLNPRMTAGNIIGEPLVVHGLVRNKNEYREKVADPVAKRGPEPLHGRPFPPRVQRRPTPAHRRGPGAVGQPQVHRGRRAGVRPRTCRFRRKSSTCWRNCKSSST